jgi:hypothetical protein
MVRSILALLAALILISLCLISDDANARRASGQHLFPSWASSIEIKNSLPVWLATAFDVRE